MPEMLTLVSPDWRLLMDTVTPWFYQGRVGHDVSEGFCSCGGYHYPEDGIEIGTKTALVSAENGEPEILVWREPE